MKRSKKTKQEQTVLGDELFGTRLGESREASPKKSGSELFIIDNSDQDWKVRDYLHDWCQLSQSIDIATGYFEIGSLLALGDEWQKVDQLRIIMRNDIYDKLIQVARSQHLISYDTLNIELNLSLNFSMPPNRDLIGH